MWVETQTQIETQHRLAQGIAQAWVQYSERRLVQPGPSAQHSRDRDVDARSGEVEHHGKEGQRERASVLLSCVF